MKVLGIDPGLADLGYGIVEQDARGGPIHHVAHGVVHTLAGMQLAGRLRILHDELSRIIEEQRPNVAAIEELFFAANMKTAVAVAQARGVAILATARSGIPLSEYTPPQIKLALAGHGRATKLQVQKMVRAVLGLQAIPEPDHAADALAVAICHLHSQGVAAVRAAGLRPTPGEVLSPNKILLEQQRGKRKRR